LLREEAAKHRTRIGAVSVTVIVLSLGLFGIVVGVAYWFAREEQKAIKRTPPEEMDENERRARREAAASISNFPPS
jgi:beta-lactamase regulating signal transducer with metallopeptidase domain